MNSSKLMQKTETASHCFVNGLLKINNVFSITITGMHDKQGFIDIAIYISWKMCLVFSGSFLCQYLKGNRPGDESAILGM